MKWPDQKCKNSLAYYNTPVIYFQFLKHKCDAIKKMNLKAIHFSLFCSVCVFVCFLKDPKRLVSRKSILSDFKNKPKNKQTNKQTKTKTKTKNKVKQIICFVWLYLKIDIWEFRLILFYCITIILNSNILFTKCIWFYLYLRVRTV